MKYTKNCKFKSVKKLIKEGVEAVIEDAKKINKKMQRI